jgi:hypothetical protein
MPPYAAARDFVRFNDGPDRNIEAVTVPDYSPGWNSFGPAMPLLDLRRQTRDAAVFVFDLNRDGFSNLSAVWQPGPMTDTAALATFGDSVALQEADVQLEKEEDTITVTLLWQVLKPPEMPLSAFVHLYDENGALVAQHDGPPGDAFAPSLFWETADQILDSHNISLSSELAAGTYTLATGLYSTLDGQRLAARTNRARLPNDIYILQQVMIP